MPQKKEILCNVGTRAARQAKVAKPRKRLNARRLKETGFIAPKFLNALRTARAPTKVKSLSLPRLIFKHY